MFRKATTVALLFFGISLSLVTNCIAAEFPVSDPSKSSFIAVVDSGASQNRISGGWTSILPKCESLEKIWCISNLEIDLGDGKFKAAKFLKYVNNSLTDKTPPSNTGIRKSAISVWFVTDLNGKQRNFAVHSVLGPSLFSASVYAFKEIPSRVRDDSYDQMSFPLADYRLTNPGYIDDCVYVSEGTCAQRISFENAKVRLSQYVSNAYSTWLAGRIANPQVEVIKINSEQSEIVVSGSSLSVPHILRETPGVDRLVASGCNDVDEYAKRFPSISRTVIEGICTENRNKYEKCFPVNTWEIGSYRREECAYSTSMTSTNFSVSPFTNNVNLFKTAFDSIENSSIEPEIWSFQSSSQSNKSNCLDSDSYIGILSTNALVYDAYPPKIFNNELTYRVASPHRNSKNEINLGVFELQLNSKIVKCLYNFNDSPLQVTVSILEENGELQIATSNWSESNGTLRVNLTGFHYSAPEIKIKINQIQAPKLEKLERPRSEKTIVCVKGKFSKKITAISPKCPVGYKKI